MTYLYTIHYTEREGALVIRYLHWIYIPVSSSIEAANSCKTYTGCLDFQFVVTPQAQKIVVAS